MAKHVIDLPADARSVEFRPQNFGRGKFDVRAADDAAVIELYDAIGEWGVSAKGFADRLAGVKASNLTLKLNSPGGDVFDGIAIYNQLVQSGKTIRVEIMGLAASAASAIAMAGDEIAMAENSFLMIHNAWGVVAGNRHDMTGFAAVLSQIDAALVRTYAARVGGDGTDIAAMMDAETWLSADQAVEDGWADEVIGKVDALAFDLSVYHNAPRELPSGNVEPTRRDVERALRDAGVSRAKAKMLSGLMDDTDLRDAGPEDVREAVQMLESIGAMLQVRS